MKNDMILRESTSPIVSCDELAASMKDDRINTKRALAADKASRERVQEHNSRVIAACEKELKRKDLTEDQRNFYLERMSRAAESTAYESAASRAFQEKQLEYTHRQQWIIIALVVIVLAGSVVSKCVDTQKS